MRKITLLSLVFFLLFSCKKETVESFTDTERDSSMAQDNNTAENTSDDVSIMADDAYNYGKLQSRGGSGGSSIMGDTVKITKVDSTITIDFGVNGIVGKDGKTRKGKIIITFTGGFKKVGASVSQTFDNYYVDGRKVAGTRSITYNGLDANQYPYWTIQSNLTITKTNGKVITWNSTRTRTMVAGSSTPLNWSDDEYKITGSATGTTSLGDTYTLTITTPLYIKVGCQYIQDGVIVHTRNARTVSINYGYSNSTSACDNQAQLTYNGVTTVITL